MRQEEDQCSSIPTLVMMLDAYIITMKKINTFKRNKIQIWKTHKVDCPETPMADFMEIAEYIFGVLFEEEFGEVRILHCSFSRGRWHYGKDGIVGTQSLFSFIDRPGIYSIPTAQTSKGRRSKVN